MAGVNDGRDGREVFVKNIDRDEMRSGFLVTSHRKKLWNVQIGLLNEFARICKKYKLRWFAYAGTLIGAARHKGFIPWDDDTDVAMFRPDYEEFKRVALAEIKEPYFLEFWYNYKFDSETHSSNHKDIANLQSVSLDEERKTANLGGWNPIWPKVRIRDSRTCQILWSPLDRINQGIWLDIFPLDPAPPFKNTRQAKIFEAAQELHIAAMYPDQIRNALVKNVEFTIPRDELAEFVSMPLYMRGALLDKFMEEKFFESPKVARTVQLIFLERKIIHTTADFDKTILLPFEKIQLPAPAGYDGVLRSAYGNWRELKIYPPHIIDYSADISYKEYFQKTAFK